MRTLEALGWWLIMPCVLPFGAGKLAVRKLRRKRAQWKNDVRPLPRRRNSLSIESSPPPPATKKPKHKIPPNPQLDCALLSRLPLELRLQIYAFVFGGPVIHLVQIPRRIAHTRCRLSAAQDATRKCRPATWAPLDSRLGTVATANLALLKTCRRVYTEAAHVLYATNTFDVNALSTFLGFTRTVTPSRLAAITRLNLSWMTVEMSFLRFQEKHFQQWWRCWFIIAFDMPGLRDLILWIIYAAPEWVAPLTQVRGLRRFELHMEVFGDADEKVMAEMKALERQLVAWMTSDSSGDC
ncbi:hypothetical protein MMC07_008677 [Pseudocyphellaria aurata]|nr:hypothetical protein [Pseudocyphellaria aurata]